MNGNSLHFAIVHAGYDPKRSAGLVALVQQLADQGVPDVKVFVSAEREHSNVWAARAWAWIGALPDNELCVLLNDDITVPPNFVDACMGLVAAAPPDTLISLHLQGATARQLATLGARFARLYCYTGPGVIMSPAVARALLAYGQHPGRWEGKDCNEDQIASRYLYSVQRPAWACIPALVKHDTEVPSTYGPVYDKHEHRQSLVHWDDSLFAAVDLTAPWPSTPPPFMESAWFSTGQMERMRQRDLGWGQPEEAPGPRIAIATPRRYGDWCPEYDDMIRGLLKSPRFEVLGVMFPEDDICRARARVVRLVLGTSRATHLLMLDADNYVDAATIGVMFRADKDVVCCPYPKKRTEVQVNEMVLPAGLGDTLLRYSIRPLPDWQPAHGINLDATKCWEISSTGLGCCLVKRHVLEAMVEHYAPTDTIMDLGHPTVDLFDLLREPMLGDDGAHMVTVEGHPIFTKYSEDHSFFERWRAMGGQVHAYLGPGAPAKHHGRTAFVGSLAAFGLPTGGA